MQTNSLVANGYNCHLDWLHKWNHVTYMACDTYFKDYSKMSESSIEKALISEEWEFFVTMQIMNASPGAWCYEYAKCLSSKETLVLDILSRRKYISHSCHHHLHVVTFDQRSLQLRTISDNILFRVLVLLL